MKKNLFFTIIFFIFFVSCENKNNINKDSYSIEPVNFIHEVNLNVDLSSLSESEKSSIELFIEASKIIDSIYLFENTENFQEIFANIEDEKLREKFIFNFGPWDRFNENNPFIEGIDKKPLGANFYPIDITTEEFSNFTNECKKSHYTFLRRDSLGSLKCVSYSNMLSSYYSQISDLLDSASMLVENTKYSEYLTQKSTDLQTDYYKKSDSIWISLTDNKLDFVIGPLQIFDDKLFNLKAEHLSLLLLKDEDWSEKMQKYNQWLKFLQKAIPVPEEYRAEEPSTNSSISVYNVAYFGGAATAGGVLMSIVLPLEAQTQLNIGVRNIQFKNIIEFKFEEIVKPISNLLLIDAQKKYVTSDAFFINTLFFEMSNSLGIKNTLNNNGSVRNAIKDYYTVSSYIKNYALSLFIVDNLFEINELPNDIENNYITFVVNLIRLIRFGVGNDYANANLVYFNYLFEQKAISYNQENEILIDFVKMKKANEDLTKDIIIMQGNGNYQSIKEFVDEHLYINENLYKLITKINENKIPTDIKINQGKDFMSF